MEMNSNRGRGSALSGPRECHSFATLLINLQMPFQTAGPRGLPVSLFLSSPEQGLSVCVCVFGGGGRGVARATLPTPLSSAFGNL